MAQKPALPKLNFGGTGKSSLAGYDYVKSLFGSSSSPYAPTSATAAPAAPTSFQDILAADPFYQAALGNLTAQGVSDKASRDAALRTGYMRFGDAGDNIDLSFLPADLRKEVGTIITPDIRALAKQNDTAGLSILARLMDAAKQANMGSVNALGARGLFRSGETGYQLGRNQLYASQANFDATNKFLDFVMGVQAAYIAAQRAIDAQKLAEQQAAAGRAGPGTTGGGTTGGGATGGGTGGGPLHGGHNPYTEGPTHPAGSSSGGPLTGSWGTGTGYDPGIPTPGWKPPVYPDELQYPFGWGQGGTSGGRAYAQ